MLQPIAVAVADPSHVSAARLETQRLARQLEFDETGTGRVAIAVTEAVTNMLRHAGGGTLLAQPTALAGRVGLEVLAIDRGPGMADFAHSSRDGVSTGGTAGTGLGAMQRLSDEFEAYTGPTVGSVMRMAFWTDGKRPEAAGYEIGGLSVAKQGETVCGDAWEAVRGAGGVTMMVADGLGHGPDAARAAGTAAETLRRNSEYGPRRILDLVHGRLRSTRGAAVAVIRHEAGSPEVTFAGVGNIAATLWDGKSRRSMVSHNGIVGHNVHKTEEYHYPWPREALLVVHSDGLESHWSLDAFPGIYRSHASVIAALLFREHSRKRDDVTVMVARRTD